MDALHYVCVLKRAARKSIRRCLRRISQLPEREGTRQLISGLALLLVAIPSSLEPHRSSANAQYEAPNCLVSRSSKPGH